MTVASTYTPPQYLGDGVTKGFSFPYSFFAAGDLGVLLFDTSAGASVSPAPVVGGSGTYDYTVSGTRDAETGEYLSGGTVTLNTAPPSTYTVTLTRSVGATQNVALSDGAPFPAKTIEGALDRLTMVAQQLTELVARTVAFPASDSGTLIATLPAAASRALKAAMFDASGNIIAGTLTGTGTPVSSVMQPVVAAATAQQAFDLLAVNGGTIGAGVTVQGAVVGQGFTTTGSVSAAAVSATGTVSAAAVAATGTLSGAVGAFSGVVSCATAAVASEAPQWGQLLSGGGTAWDGSVGASRSLNTIYTNSFGRPIVVMVALTLSTSSTVVVISGPTSNVTIASETNSSTTVNSTRTVTFVVMPGDQYQVTVQSGTATKVTWCELH